MALIIMCCYDTEENGRSEYTERTLRCLGETVNWNKHRLIVVDNGSCDATKVILSRIKNAPETGNFGVRLPGMSIITNTTNLGTARAINQGIKLRNPGEHCIKIDNDVVIHQSGWVDELEEAIERDPTIGVLGLKRKDLCQTPYHADPDFRSELIQLPHEPGQRWIVVEKSRDVMGTCTMLNWRMLDVLGGFQDCSLYGFDDTLLNLRSLLAGFWNAFLPHIDIDHIDRADNEYIQEKQKVAAEAWPKYHEMHKGYLDGSLPLKVEI
jgi:GT2 family glycosyltransferase